MPDAIVTALIAGIAATVGALLTYLTASRRVRVEGISAEAAADLARAQASGEIVQLLRGEVQRLQASHEDSLIHVASLAAEVHGLRTRLAEFEIIVLTLPEEYRERFSAVLMKSKPVAPTERKRGILGAQERSPKG